MRGDEIAGAPVVVGVSGSLRRESSNTKLVHEAFRAFGPSRTALGDLRLPLYDGDLEREDGIPAEVERLAQAIRDADGVVIATPEYNKNLSGVLKNALDWLSRTKPAPLAGKPVAVVSAAAGRSGGALAQYSLRHCLTPLRAKVLPGPEVSIAGANAAFDENGRLKDPKSFEFLGSLMDELRAEIARMSREAA